MTVATQEDYRIELIDGSLVTRALLDEAHGVAYALGLYGYGRQGGLALHVDSLPARMIRDGEEHWYIRVYRKGVYLRTYMVERDDYGYEPNAAKEEDYLELTLTTAEHVFERVECLPDPDSGPPIEPFITPDLPLDDAVKWIVSHACGPDAYDSPLGASRVMAGLTIEAYASAHPTSQIVEVANRMNLYEFLVQFCVTWEIDFSLDLVETIGDANEWVFRTYTPRRGLDKTEGNGARDPVIINDTSLNIISGRRHRDHLFATTVVSRALDNEITDAALEAAYGRHEKLADTNDDDKMTAQLHENRQRLGFEWDYNETDNCQIVDHFVPGDLVTTNNLRLGMPAENQLVKEIYVTLPSATEEKVALVFGEYEKTINDQSGGGGVEDDPYGDLSDDAPKPIIAVAVAGTEDKFSRRDHQHRGVIWDDAGAEVAPTATGEFKIHGVGGITATRDGADASLLKISGAGLVPVTRTVTAGNGLTGGGALSGDITLAVGAGDGVTVSADAVALTTPGTLTVSTTNNAASNHTHAVTTTAIGAASTIMALDANGYTRVERLEIHTSGKYLARTGTALQVEADGYHFFSIGGTNVVRISSTALYSYTDGAATCGLSDHRWSTDYCVDLNASGVVYIGADCNLYRSAANTLKTDDALYVTGQITAASGSTSIACSGDITMVANKTVDGVDVSAHKHDYRQVVDNGLDDTDGVITSTWTPTGSPWWNTNYLRKSSDGTKIFLANTAFNTAGGAGYTEVSIGASKHTHYVGYSDTADTSAPV